MPLYHGFERFSGDTSAPDQDYYVSIGNFDGVHVGHQKILAKLRERAAAGGKRSIVLTFDPHPLTLLRPDRCPPRLTTVEAKADLIFNHGIDDVVAYPTDRKLLEMTPDEFFEEIVLKQLQACGLVEGPNFFFGKDRAGDIEKLKSLCEGHALSLDVLHPEMSLETMVSSSQIRRALAQGNIEWANQQLGRKYAFSGTVVAGAQRGRQIGFPTANLSEVKTLIPGDGVYAAIAKTENQTHLAAVSIGPNPTFADDNRKIEAHLLDFQGDLYGKTLHLHFAEKIRDLQTFTDIEALKQQVTCDLEQTRKTVISQ